MNPRKTLDSKAQKRAAPAAPKVENYNDELPRSLVESLRERFGGRLDNAKPVSEASW